LYSIVGILALMSVVVSATAKGTATYKSKTRSVTVTFRHAFLVKMPEAATGKPIRRLLLTVTDISAALKACKTSTCIGDIPEGMTVDFDSGARLPYWFVANDQLTQYSGMATKPSASLTADTPARLAGTLKFDDSGAGGPVVDVTFDANLVTEIKK
jgi:hypothetical protein